MATTSPDNLRTPDPGDPYNLVPDLATLSGDVQTALNKRSVTSGTVAQRTAFTASATAGWLWQDTDSIKMIWRKDGAAWVPAVWRWSGTNSEMTAFAAPNGFEWFNLTNGTTYLRISGQWEKAERDPWVHDFTMTLASQANKSEAVTFPAGRFTAPPLVQVTKTNGALAMYIPYVVNVTASGCTVGLQSGNNTNASGAQALQLVVTDHP